MSKKSSGSRKNTGTGAFANAPFKGLKGLKPVGTGRSAAPAPRIPPAVDTGDEGDLFRRAVRGARPVASDRDEPGGPDAVPPMVPAEDAGGDESGQELFLQAMGRLGTATVREDDLADAEGDDAPARSSSGRMRQLRRGMISISEELDLHGFLKDEALRRLGHFISSAHARGRAAVLVITGKGLNSPEGAVLPGAVSAWLREQGRGMVAEFHPAPRDKGGSGAYVVFLKRQRV